MSPALVVSGECTVDAARDGVEAGFSVALTEFDDESKNVESKAPSDESTRVPAGIAVGAFELAVSTLRDDGKCEGTNAAVNCAAAAVGAAASAKTATVAAQVLTKIPPVTFRYWPGQGGGISGAMRWTC